MPNDVTIYVSSKDNSGLDLDKLKTRLTDLSKTIADARVKVSGDKAATLALDRMQVKLDLLNRRVTPKISLDGAFKAKVEIDALDLSLDHLGDKNAKIGRSSGLLSGALQGLSSAFTGVIGVGGAGASAAGGWGAVGMAAAVAAAIPVLTGLGTVAIGAGIGLGAFGALALPTFTKISGALSAIAADQKAVSDATTATARNTALAKLHKDWADLTPPIAGAVKAVQGFESEFSKLAKQFQAPALQLLGVALDTARKALKPLAQLAVDAAPFIIALAKLLGTTLVNALKTLEPAVAPAFKAFLPLVRSVTDLFLSLLKSLVAHMPMWVKLTKAVAVFIEGLAKVTPVIIDIIAKWAQLEMTIVSKLSHINTDVEHWWRNIKTVFDILVDYAKQGWETIQIRALSALHGILEGFSHIPIIGHFFRTAANDIEGTLSRLRGESARTSSAIQADFDRLHGKNVSITVNAEGFWAVAKAGGHAGSGPTGTKHGAAGMRVTGGIPGRDSVLASLMPGEVVVPTGMVNAGAVDHLRGRIPGLAAGGVVGAFHGGPGPLGRWLSTDMAATERIIEKATAAATAAALKAGPPGGLGGFPGGGSSGPGAAAAQRYASSVLGLYGWGQGQMSSLIPLWNGESGWRWNALNASSGAYGIPQSLPASKMAAAGADWRTNPATQIRWGLGYIKGAYGSPATAYSDWLGRSPHWYGGGLTDGLFSKPTLIGVGDRGPEHVSITPAGRGGPHVTLNLRIGGSGSGLDRLMMQWLRENVRVEGGGDVQVAFGGN